MKNVSLYIARRYNTYTLLISLVIIIISAFSIGALGYVGSSSQNIIRELIYSNSSLTTIQKISVYAITLAYVLLQIGLIYLIFNRFLRSYSGNQRLTIAFIIAVVSTGISGFLIKFNYTQTLLVEIFSLILLSLGLLSLIFGLVIYLFSKTKITGVNIITSIAVFAITIATCALFIILSVFSGLEKMNLTFLSNVNPDLKISATNGKVLPDIDKITNKLDQNKQIQAYSKVIEEKVSIEFENKQDLAYIKGVDENYKNVIRIDTTVVHGNYFDFKQPYEILASDGVARRLQMYNDHQYSSRLRIPKAGTGLITTEEEAFNTAVANPIGVFIINEQFDKYVFSPLGLTHILLELPENAAYSIEIKLNSNVSPNLAKTSLQKDLGNTVLVQTRKDIDATFLKVMNVENLIIYLIFTLVIIISSFNLAGAIIIIMIDKKSQVKTMRSFGMRASQIKSIFFQTGYLITISSVIIGILLGSALGILQNTYSLVMANPYVAFPFEFTAFNYLIVAATVLIIGGSVSWFVTRKLPS